MNLDAARPKSVSFDMLGVGVLIDKDRNIGIGNSDSI